MEHDVNTPEGIEALIEEQAQPPHWLPGQGMEGYRDILTDWVKETYPDPSPDFIQAKVQYLIWEYYQGVALEHFLEDTGWDLDEAPEDPEEPQKGSGASEGEEEAPDLDSALEGLRGPVWRSYGHLIRKPYSNAVKADALCDYLLQAMEDTGEIRTQKGKKLYETLAKQIDAFYGTK